jgi:hypothetical protein
MTTTIDLPDDLLKDMHRHAVDRGEEFSRSMVKLLRQALSISRPVGNSPAVVTIQTHPQTGLPYFTSDSGSPATTLKIKELLDLEQQVLLESDLECLSVSVR